MSALLAIVYKRDELQLLDQLLLPEAFAYVDASSCEAAWEAIHSMKVRGAPAIAMAAALGLAVELARAPADAGWLASAAAAAAHVAARLDYLRTSRPTAVNLFEAADRLTAVAQASASLADATGQSVREAYIAAAAQMLADDVAANRAIGAHGADAILRWARAQPDVLGAEAHAPHTVRVLTHCNTGSLATAGYGTALGVVRALHERSAAEQYELRAFCTETRPYNQGARLTAYELVHEGIHGTLVTDSMGAALMRTQRFSAVVVGADRVAANGDTANKIGTYMLALCAQAHNVPFYVAAPLTTLDPALADGSLITIEERKADELTHVAGKRIAAPGIKVWNPAFDVTPCSLITGIITDKGLIPRGADGSFDIPAFVAAHKQ